MATAAELLAQLDTEFPNTVQQRVRQYSLRDAYRTVSWVYACVNLIADSISGVEFYFYRQDASGEKIRLESPNEPVVKCFYPPREGEIPTLAEMVKMQFLHLALFGESFMRLEKTGKMIESIDLINPLNITPVISKDGEKILKWKITRILPDGRSKTEEVDIKNIVQWKFPNPYNKFRGMAPLTAARLAIEQDLNMATWNAGFFQNGLRNPIALMLKQTFNEQQRAEFMGRIKKNFSGFARGQLPLVVEGGIDVKVLTNTMKDLDFVLGKELTREELCAVYNVPPAMAGIFRYANYSNTKEQRTMLYQNTLRPKMTYFRDVFQQGILVPYFPGVICDWEWEGHDAFREDPTVKATTDKTVADTAAIYWNIGYTMKQIARILSRPELDPETHKEPVVDVEVPEPEVPKGVPRPTYSYSKSHQVISTDKLYLRVRASELMATAVVPASQRMTSFVHAYFDKMQKGLVKKGGQTLARRADFWKEQWISGIEPLVKSTLSAGVRSAFDDLKTKPPADILEVEALTLAYNELLERAEQVIATALKIVGSADAKELTSAITTLTDAINTQRFMHAVFNRGRYEALKAMGVDEARWCSGTSCDDGAHAQLNGVSVVMGETFPSTTLTYPGESRKSDCSCTLFPLNVRRIEKKVKLTA